MDFELTPAEEYDDAPGGGGGGNGGGGASYNLPFLYDRPWSEYDVYSHIEVNVQRAGTILDLLRNLAPRKRMPTDRAITVNAFRRLIPLPDLHRDPHAREWIPRQELFLHLVIPEGSMKDGDIKLDVQEGPEEFDTVPRSLATEPPAANGGVDETDLSPATTPVAGKTSWDMSTMIGVNAPPRQNPEEPEYSPLPPGYVMVARPQRWFTPDGVKPQVASRGQSGKNLIRTDDVAAYLEILLDIEGLAVYGPDAYDSTDIPDEVRWRVRQLFWEARKWALQGPPVWFMHDWDSGDPDVDPMSHQNWRMGSFCFKVANDHYRKYLEHAKDRRWDEEKTRKNLNTWFYQTVPSEYKAEWDFVEKLARRCEDAVAGQDVQEAVSAYIDLQDVFSTVDRGAWVEKLVMVGEGGKKRPFLKIHRGTAQTRYASVYDMEDLNKWITGFNQWLELRQLMEELSMPPGKPVGSRGEWYGSALRPQRAGTLIMETLSDRTGLDTEYLDPRFYLGEVLGNQAIEDRNGTRSHTVLAGPHAFLHHSNLLLRFVDSAKKVADLGLSAAGGMLTMDAVEKAAGDMVEWGDNLIWVYKGEDQTGHPEEYHRYFSSPGDGRSLVAVVHDKDEALDIDPMWVIESDSLFYTTWPERMAGGWWEMGFPLQLGIDTETWGNYGLHRTLARAVWWLQPVEPIRRALTFVIAEAKENRETDLLGIFLRRVAGFPSGEYGRHDIEEMHWEFREDIFEWMEDRMAEQHNMISLRQFRDFMSWYAKGMWQRIGDSPEARMKGMKRLKQLAFWLYMSVKAGDNMQGDAEEDDFRGRLGQNADRIARHLASRGEPWDIATDGRNRKDMDEWKFAQRREIAFRLRNAGLRTCEGDDLRRARGPVPRIAERIRATQPANPDDLEAWEGTWEEVRGFIITQLPEMGLTADAVDFRMIRSWYYTFHSLLVVEPPEVAETVA
jgi:hypothetical protein